MMALKINRHSIKLSKFSKDEIEAIPKLVNANGCWIPTTKLPGTHGYVQITISGRLRSLHRIVLCIYQNLDYDDKTFEARHGEGCDKACFFYEHLKAGTPSDNIKDSVLHKTHHQSRKKNCPKCGGEYRIRKIKTGFNKGRIYRECINCLNLKNWARKLR